MCDLNLIVNANVSPTIPLKFVNLLLPTDIDEPTSPSTVTVADVTDLVDHDVIVQYTCDDGYWFERGVTELFIRCDFASWNDTVTQGCQRTYM